MEDANTRARGGCCCCGRGITSAPLTRKTFRLNLVLDSARLLSTHPNRIAFLARPKRSANPSPPPFLPLSTHTLQVLPDRCRIAAESPALSAVCIWLHFEVININSGTVNDRGRACRRGDALCSPPLTPRYNHARRCSLLCVSPPPFSFPSLLLLSFSLVLQWCYCYARQREPESADQRLRCTQLAELFQVFEWRFLRDRKK